MTPDGASTTSSLPPNWPNGPRTPWWTVLRPTTSGSPTTRRCAWSTTCSGVVRAGLARAGLAWVGLAGAGAFPGERGVHEQHDDCPDERQQPGLDVPERAQSDVEDETAEPPAHECADHADDQTGQPAADGAILQNGLGQGAADEADDQKTEESHGQLLVR